MTNEDKPSTISLPINGVAELMEALGIQHPHYFERQTLDDWRAARDKLREKRAALAAELDSLQWRIRRVDGALESAEQAVGDE